MGTNKTDKRKMLDTWLALPDNDDKPTLREFSKRWVTKTGKRDNKNHALYKFVRSYNGSVEDICFDAYFNNVIDTYPTLTTYEEIRKILFRIGKKSDGYELYKIYKAKFNKVANKSKITRLLGLSNFTTPMVLDEGTIIVGKRTHLNIDPPRITNINGKGYLTTYDSSGMPTTTVMRHKPLSGGKIVIL